MKNAWFKTKEKPATRSDGDCEGQIWTWQEYFTTDEETGAFISVGWKVKRQGWRNCSIGICYQQTAPLLWTHCDLKQMEEPTEEMKQPTAREERR